MTEAEQNRLKEENEKLKELLGIAAVLLYDYHQFTLPFDGPFMCGDPTKFKPDTNSKEQLMRWEVVCEQYSQIKNLNIGNGLNNVGAESDDRVVELLSRIDEAINVDEYLDKAYALCDNSDSEGNKERRDGIREFLKSIVPAE